MKVQKKTEPWACLVTSFAMVMDMECGDLIERIGVDGGEVLADGLVGPQQFRGHHIQEIIDAALACGYAVTEIEANPHLLTKVGNLPIYEYKEAEKRFFNYLNTSTGVLVGYLVDRGWRHAYAVDKGIVYNPDTGTECEPPLSYRADTFYKVTNAQFTSTGA